MNIVVFDVETKTSFKEAGSQKPQDLGISFVGAYESKKDQYHSFFEHDFSGLWELFKRADRIVGFNSDKFDFPALEPLSPIPLEELPTLDIYNHVYNVVKQERISLNRLAIPTLKVKKLGHGLDAIDYYRNGELDKLEKYCLKDVEVTWKLYDFGTQNNYLMLLEKNGMITQVPVKW